MPCHRLPPTAARRTVAMPAVLLLLSPIPIVHAGQAPATTTLDAVQVSGRAGPLQAPAGSASRLGLDVLDTPAAVTVVERDTLDARGVRTTQEALAAVPGLTAAAPPGQGNNVAWRGFSGSQVSQLFNGIDVQYASIAARPVDAWQYERIEAIGGPSSFLHGVGAVGGAINYVTRLASLGHDQARWRAAWGSHRDGTVAFGMNLRDAAARQALALDLSARDGDSWIDAQQRSALAAAGSWRVRLAPGLEHVLALEWQDEDVRRPYWGVPGEATGGRLRLDPALAARNYNVGDGRYAQDVRWVRSLLEWQRGDGDRVRNTVYHYDALRDYRNVESYRLAEGGVQRSGALLQRHDHEVWGNRSEWLHEGLLAGRPARWAVGAEAAWNRQTRFPLSLPGVVDTVPVDAVAPGRFLDVPGAELAYRPDRSNRLRSQAVYAENLTTLGAGVSLLAALRHERLQLEVRNHRAPGPGNPARFERRYRPTTGRLALEWAPAPNARAYVQASTAADPPAGVLSTASFAQLRDFDLSSGRQAELGAKLQSADGRSHATLAVYRIVRRNLAVADPDNPGQTLPVGRQSARGLELAFGWKPAQRLALDGNLAWVDARLDAFTETVAGQAVSRAGNRPPNIPARVGNLWLDWQLQPRWALGAGLRAVSARQADAANSLRVPGYATWDAHLRWRAGVRTELTLRGRNLGDRRYIAQALGGQMAWPGDPRSWELVLHQAFD
jgi:Outer membrane receptor for monomeric catechols